MRIHAIFGGIGAFAVKFRWLVIAVWLIAAFAVPRFLPSLNSVTQGNNSAFLPASAPSEQAAQLAAPFGTTNLVPVQVIAAVDQGTLTTADTALLATLQHNLSTVPTVVSVRDLGRSTEAARYAGRSVGAAPEGRFDRSDFFVTLVLADSYLAAGEAELACATALAALEAGEQIRSGRCVNYLREFRDHLVVAEDTAAVQDFSEQAVQSRMWRIAGQPDKSAAVA